MKNFKAVICLLLVFVLICLTACLGGTASYKLKAVSLEGTIAEKNAEKQLLTETKDRDKLLKISKSDMTVLYFDKENYSVCVYDTNGKHLWKSLPERYTDGAPAVLSADVYVGAKKYMLNSQSDSVKKGLASYEIDKNSVTVTYKFEFSVEGTEKISFSVPVKYAMSDSTMTASIDCSQIRLSEPASNIVISSISLLNYFGSSTEGSKGDYIFVPEGPGAIIDIEKNADDFKKITVPVYGADLASEDESTYSARLAAYGIKSGENAFAALIESGDAISKINAAKALKKSGYNRVGASFDITKVKDSDEKVYASKVPYDGEIKVSYRFLSGNNANYVAMASAIRESLIRNGTLSLKESSVASEYPFVLSVIGAASVGKEKSKVQTFTNLEEAEEIISFIRSKGINNVALRYRGIFDGQLFGNDAGSLKLYSGLGSKENLAMFLQYTDMQNIRVYPEVNLISANKGKVAQPTKAIDGKKLVLNETKIDNGVVYASGESNYASFSKVENRTNDMLAKLKEYSFGGVCIADAGNRLYSSYSSKNAVSRQGAADIISSQTASISSSQSIMTDDGNIYAVKYSDFIVNLPNTSKLAKRDYCTSVPFLQILLHGIIPYSSTPVNLCKNSDTAVLRAAQYGEILSYEFYYENAETENDKDNFYYMNFATHAQNAYERLSALYADLASRKITNHYCVKKGVYCTEFGDGVSVYVNYNSKDAKVNGVTIEAKSFLKVE